MDILLAKIEIREEFVLPEKKIYELTHAKHDRALCLAPGLFVSLKRGSRKTKLDIIYDFSPSETLRFLGDETLGVHDLRLLQVIIALAGFERNLLKPNSTCENEIRLRTQMALKYDAIGSDTLLVKTTTSRLLSEIGMTDGGDNINAVQESLARMSNVTVIVEKGESQQSFRLLSHLHNGFDRRLWVALNPRSARAILGSDQYTRIDLNEARRLKSDSSRLIHQRLCAWIDHGKSRQVSVDVLSNYVWTIQSANTNTNKTRRQSIQKALAEIRGVGWSIEEYAKLKWFIKRPPNRSEDTRNP